MLAVPTADLRFTTSGVDAPKFSAKGGILTPTESDLVLIFPGARGEQFGYRDWWDGEGVFHYFGAGQQGGIAERRGPPAIRADPHHESGQALGVNGAT